MIRVIGDVHNKLSQYVPIAQEAEHSLQLGDMGFDYTELSELNPRRHRFFGGNHDNYDLYDDSSYALGDYGSEMLGCIEFFYVRGSISIDCVQRVQDFILSGHKSWWYEEELNSKQLEAAIDLYTKIKPNIMITHDCPSVIKSRFASSTAMKRFGWPEDHTCLTQQALTVMHETHPPKLHFLGHWHRNWNAVIDGTHFIMIDELSWVDLKKENGRYIVTSPEGKELANISA